MGWIQLITGAISGVSALDKAEKRKQAEQELENMGTPTFRKNQGIIDFYDEALRKYKVQPTETTEYKLAKQNIGQNVVQGSNAAQDRRSGLAAVPSLISGQNNALLKAAINAENQKQRQAGTVMQSANQATAENMRDYRYNQMGPYEKNYNLLAMKAAGLAKSENVNIGNAYNNLSAWAASDPFKYVRGDGKDNDEDGGAPDNDANAYNNLSKKGYKWWKTYAKETSYK